MACIFKENNICWLRSYFFHSRNVVPDNFCKKYCSPELNSGKEAMIYESFGRVTTIKDVLVIMLKTRTLEIIRSQDKQYKMIRDAENRGLNINKFIIAQLKDIRDLGHYLKVVKQFKVKKSTIKAIKKAINNKPHLPPKMTMVKNFVKFAAGVAATAVRDKTIMCCEEQWKRRFEFCSKKCSNFTKIKGKARCATFPGGKEGCGCFLNAKVRFAASKCKHWDIIDKDYMYVEDKVPPLGTSE
jgi:hypothetical protein